MDSKSAQGRTRGQGVPRTLVPMDGRVGIVGAGTMGAGIAQVALEAGRDVGLFDTDLAAVERARERITGGLIRRLTKTATDPGAIGELVALRMDRLTAVGSLAELAESADLVIEAAVEDLGVKRRAFAILDAAAPPAALLASNTSALSISAIATATRHPERVLGLHFFNPAPVMALVEVVAGKRTDEGAVARATALMAGWGKTPISSADAPGFIVNRVNRPFTLEALRMLERGDAGVPDIDAAIKADGFPMGPFSLMDLIGIDVNLAVTRAIHEGFLARGDSDADRFRPSPLQVELVAAGHLGRKSGQGFYRYQDGMSAGPSERFAAEPAARLDRAVIVQQIRRAIAGEAHRAADEHVAAPADIDRALRLGAGHPEGPFGWERA